MKTLLLIALSSVIAIGANSQSVEGYSWKFPTASTSPFASSQAIPNSSTYNLTKFGAGTFTTGVSVSTGLGTSCTGAIDVANFNPNMGLRFDNDNGAGGHPVDSTYTIEMVIKFDADGVDRRLISFHDFGATNSDDGIYVDAMNRLAFWANGHYSFIDEGMVTPDYIEAGEWHHILLMRDNSTKRVTLYQNGVYRGSYLDDRADIQLVPNAANNYAITFLKDDTNEEASGQLAKLSIYNRTLGASEVLNSYNNICSGSFQLTASAPLQGYQWLFSNTPFNPFTSVLAGNNGNAAVSYTLSQLGGGTITQTDDNDLATFSPGCIAPTKVGSFSTDFGLNFSNDPLLIGDEYTIEMVVKFEDEGTWIRLVGFADPTGPDSDHGFYLTGDGKVVAFNDYFYDFNPAQTPLTLGEWAHITFTRNHITNEVKYYLNGVEQGSFVNDGHFPFIPVADNDYGIYFLKDDSGEESAGSVAKLAVFNTVLNPVQVQQRFISMCGAQAIPLPVRLVNFEANKAGAAVQLKWTTSSEQSNAGFEVQRSTDGVSFATIGFVAGNGTTTATSHYNFTDNTPASGKNYYRLKQTDIDGKTSFSTFRIVDMDADRQAIQLFPNPAKTSLTITRLEAGDRISIFNNQGALMSRKTATNTQETINVSQLSQGVYLLQVTDAKNESRVVRFTKM